MEHFFSLRFTRNWVFIRVEMDLNYAVAGLYEVPASVVDGVGGSGEISQKIPAGLIAMNTIR